MRAVVFDLDGTLLDHRGAVTDALARWLPSLGAPASAELIDAWFAAEERHFPAWRRGEISFTEQRRRRLLDVLPLVGHPVGTADDLDLVFAGYLRHYETAWRVFDDVAPALGELRARGIQLAVLTNGTTEQQNAKLAKVGLSGRLGPVFTAEDLGVAKPELRAYAAVCGRLGLPPELVLHVGDLYGLDVTAPRAAGLQAVHLDRNDEAPHDEPLRITSLRDLGRLLRA